MDGSLLYTSISFVFLLVALKLLLRTSKRHLNLPPSPPSLPVIGHLHLIKLPAFRSFYKLSQKYGPVLSLQFGSRLVVVISSPDAVQECFTKNDIILANRPRLLAGKHISYNYTTMAVSPYGDHWRNLRRIGAVEIFSTGRLNAFSGIRRDEVKRLLRKLSQNSFEKFSVVELKPVFSDLTFNIMMRLVAGKRYYGDDVSDEGVARSFRDIMKQLVVLGGGVNPADFLPFMNWIVPNGYEKRLKKVGKRMDAFLQGLVDECRKKKDEVKNTMVDHLLSLQESEPEYYSDQIIKGIIMVMLLAGTETAVVTLDWALSHLLNNPEVLKKARAELDSEVGQERLVEEHESLNLRYLRGIINETLRLNPAAPTLVPHCASEDCTIAGYDVPADTIVLVNAWAIHRDPNLWEEPTKFKPERYENGEAESQNLMPFGLGRRACPGAGMAQRVVSFTLASLIQSFDWETVGDKKVDMTEGRGGFMQKAVPLEAKCRARPIMSKIIAEAAAGV